MGPCRVLGRDVEPSEQLKPAGEDCILLGLSSWTHAQPAAIRQSQEQIPAPGLLCLPSEASHCHGRQGPDTVEDSNSMMKATF